MRDYVGDALRDDRNKAPVPKVRRKSREEYLREAYPLSYYAEFNTVLQLDWIIKGVLAKGHNSYLFGPPGGGKSALYGSAATYVAAGRENWHDFDGTRRSGPKTDMGRVSARAVRRRSSRSMRQAGQSDGP
jgi:hypothetical protein